MEESEGVLVKALKSDLVQFAIIVLILLAILGLIAFAISKFSAADLTCSQDPIAYIEATRDIACTCIENGKVKTFGK